jgi:hypothetical protein
MLAATGEAKNPHMAARLRERSGDSRGAFLDGIERDAVATCEFLRALRDDETQPGREQRWRASASSARSEGSRQWESQMPVMRRLEAEQEDK